MKEDNRSGQIDGSEKADGVVVVAGGARAVVLEFGEAVCNQRARLIIASIYPFMSLDPRANRSEFPIALPLCRLYGLRVVVQFHIALDR